LFAECGRKPSSSARASVTPRLLDAFQIVRVPEATPAQVVALLEPYGQRLGPAGHARARTPRAGSSSCSPHSGATPHSPARRFAFVDYCSLQKKTDVSLGELTTTFRRVVRLPVDLLAPETGRSTPLRSRRSLRKGVIGQTTRAPSPAA